MKRTLIITLFAAVLSIVTSCKDKNAIIVNNSETPKLETAVDSASWAMGFTMAQTIASTGIEPNRKILFEAICATLDSRPQALTESQTYTILSNLDQLVEKARTEKQSEEYKEVREREAAYFSQLTAENPNVKKSDKGFYYEVLREGKGPKAEIGKVVTFDYKGLFTNGQIFDQTYGNREPITHIVGEPMMVGLKEGMCLMNEGSKYRFYFPAELAFGADGGDGIPPYSTMIYEVELHEIRVHN